jgi:hypothetical protein
MKKKVIILLIGYYIFGIVQSCDLHYCEDVDYYDFAGLNAAEKDSIIAIDDSLNIIVQAINLDWMTQIHFNYGLIANSYALGCNEGWAGMKYPLTKVEITSNSDFNEEHPANSILNDLITISLCTAEGYYDCDSKYLNLDDIELNKFMNPQNQYLANLYLVKRPSKEQTHRFTIKLFKSDGTVISTETNNIIWE